MASFDPREVAVRCAHFIGGRSRDARAELEVFRPSDGGFQSGLPCASADLVDEVVEGTWRAWKASDWASRPPRERARVMRRWADLVEADGAVLGPLEAVGSTRPLREVLAWDIPYVAEGIRFFAEFADKHGGEVAATATSHLGLQITEPYGVVGAIAPWNFPLSMAGWKIAPALAAGNAVVIKPSELTPFSILRLAELATLAGLPAGILSVVQGDGRVTGDALCRHPRIGKVTFTGSTGTGTAIMTACAESGPKPVTLELGGKSPQLVFADAPDLARTARSVAAAITGNAGQVCVSGSRLLVQRAALEPMLEGIRAAFVDLRPGPTWSAAATLSPIISQRQGQRIQDIVTRSQAAGAEILVGGALEEGLGGAYYQPTLITGVGADNPAVGEEIFGPVLTVQVFDDEAEALVLADHPTYGLAAGVHTADLGRALRLTRALEAGTVWVNRYGRSHDWIIPTGGYKRSGIGKDLGRAAYEATLRSKSVLIDLEHS
ncbi:aldehyde dehydrogenase family protein [Pseudomonas oryzihabitans]|uniref:aldehyde dehydrogenase family protein n=1 Tax=Pseudomonas oryzihabitans TaxID=47885 RepID=UPI00214DF2B8|nr:aldehyde dehydrogenase family protein [Pseudomonas psychrotolerans]UUW73131.1 aldehyde dehydrogenase family protein [Pseudomonas psychrotolerans]